MNPKQLNVLLSILVVILLAVVGYGYTRLRALNQENGHQKTTGETILPTSSSKEQPSEIFTDKANLYSIKLPEQWQIIGNDGARGVSLSSMAAQSPEYKERIDETADGPFHPIYYESGAKLEIGVEKGEKEPSHYGEGGGPETGVLSKKIVTVDGVNGVYHIFKEPSTYQGQLLDVHLNRAGNNYLLRLAYDPATYPQGEKVFADLLNSFRFIK